MGEDNCQVLISFKLTSENSVSNLTKLSKEFLLVFIPQQFPFLLVFCRNFHR